MADSIPESPREETSEEVSEEVSEEASEEASEETKEEMREEFMNTTPPSPLRRSRRSSNRSGDRLSNRAVGFAFAAPMLLAGVLLGGCASPNIQVGVQTRSEVYDARLDPHEVVGQTPPNIAILPTTVSGASGGFAPFANLAIDRLIRQAREGGLGQVSPFFDSLAGVKRKVVEELSIYSVTEAVNILNANGNSMDLTELLLSTVNDTVADRAKLVPVAGVLGVEYLMIPWLGGVHTDNSNRFTFAGLSFLRTSWITIEITLQLWHVPSGRLVWQSVGSGNIVGEGVVGTSPPLAESVEQIMRPMLRAFLSGESEVVTTTQVRAPASRATEEPTVADAPSTENPEAAGTATAEVDGTKAGDAGNDAAGETGAPTAAPGAKDANADSRDA